MNIHELIEHFNSGKNVKAGTEAHDLLLECSHEAMRITSELNASYHSADQIRELMSRLTGKPIDASCEAAREMRMRRTRNENVPKLKSALARFLFYGEISRSCG